MKGKLLLLIAGLMFVVMCIATAFIVQNPLSTLALDYGSNKIFYVIYALVMIVLMVLGVVFNQRSKKQ
ncbi:MAG: hypothetical protein ACOX4I_05285 [Anaerovoracaceae bacterium]|jgi:NADH:ubiquinone oxidoreductase subunit 3 (subunit A)